MHIGGGHRKVHRPGVEHRMPEGDNFVAVAVRDRADAAEIQIAAHQLDADGGAGLQIRVRVRDNGFRRAAALHRRDAPCRQFLFQRGERARIEAGDDERRVNRRELHALAFAAAPREHLAGSRLRGRVQPLRVLQHFVNRRDADNRFFQKGRGREGQRADQLAVNVNRAAAHARQHARLLQRQRPAGDSRHNLVAAGALVG